MGQYWVAGKGMYDGEWKVHFFSAFVVALKICVVSFLLTFASKYGKRDGKVQFTDRDGKRQNQVWQGMSL